MKVSVFQIATVRAFLDDERAKEQIKNEMKEDGELDLSGDRLLTELLM
ncbi:MAG TPA: hypothetical protein VE956_02505 [Nodularia sp. (in: cyanobacteria)]|nr:hypothetical protein [Nodularia sp. (in: cyanobacteria)]